MTPGLADPTRSEHLLVMKNACCFKFGMTGLEKGGEVFAGSLCSSSFYDDTTPTYTSRRNLPPSMINASKVVHSIISHGCVLDNCSIEHSVIGLRSHIGSNVSLKDTVMFGADLYEADVERARLLAKGRVPIGIGESTTIRKCIIDKNARIGRNVTIVNSEGNKRLIDLLRGSISEMAFMSSQRTPQLEMGWSFNKRFSGSTTAS